MNQIDLEKLPSPPGVAVKLLELFSSSDVSPGDLNDVIGADPALTGKVIKFANSPTFARRTEATTLRQAIAMLGANGVKTIALSFSLTDVGSSNSTSGFSFDNFWNASLATAVCVKAIFKAMSKDADQGFLTGLLLDIGQLALFCDNPEEYEELKGERTENDLELVKLETEKYGESRYSLGGRVLKNWHFPEAIADSFSNFDPVELGDNVNSKVLDLARRMSYLLLKEEPDYDMVKQFSEDLRNVANLCPEEAENLFRDAGTEHGQFALLLNFNHLQQRSLKEIELEAKLKIVEMSVNLQIANAQVTEERNQLADMAYIDKLTGLGNRRKYDSVAEAEMERCRRTGNSLGLVVVDIDHFKKVNDTYGHAAGDAILASVASRISNLIRTYDSVFRFGGEEFVIILAESDVEVCAGILERIRLTIASESFTFEKTDIPVTISLGAACYSPRSVVQNLDELFERADKALYEAKHGGRNQWRIDTCIDREPGNYTFPTVGKGFDAIGGGDIFAPAD